VRLMERPDVKATSGHWTKGLRLATQFLTRIPVGSVEAYSAEEFSRSSVWFPLVGLGIGTFVALIVFVCSHRSTSVAAVLGLVVWVLVTGALHLDGLADLTDALAASHRNRERFFAVLADPHIGTFGVVSVVLALMLKAVGLAQLSPATMIAFPLVPAWARLGTLAWSRWLKVLKPGQGERFAGRLHAGWIMSWTLVLLAASAAVAPILCVAPLVIAAWGGWLKWRLGGTTGDCLGAGVEVTEVVLVLVLGVVGVGWPWLGWPHLGTHPPY
jgi:adenosylcobinamide-GDP ribazoletransferase